LKGIKNNMNIEEIIKKYEKTQELDNKLHKLNKDIISIYKKLLLQLFLILNDYYRQKKIVGIEMIESYERILKMINGVEDKARKDIEKNKEKKIKNNKCKMPVKVIYFLMSSIYVKISISTDLYNTIDRYKNGNPNELQLLGTIKSNKYLELELLNIKKKFYESKIPNRRDWYYLNYNIVQYIKDNCKKIKL